MVTIPNGIHAQPPQAFLFGEVRRVRSLVGSTKTHCVLGRQRNAMVVPGIARDGRSPQGDPDTIPNGILAKAPDLQG